MGGTEREKRNERIEKDKGKREEEVFFLDERVREEKRKEEGEQERATG